MKTYLRFKGYNPLILDLLGAPYNILISVTGNLAKKISQRVSKAGVKKNALTLTFRGHRDGKVPRIEWDQYYLHMLPLVLEHPKLMLADWDSQENL